MKQTKFTPSRYHLEQELKTILSRNAPFEHQALVGTMTAHDFPHVVREMIALLEDYVTFAEEVSLTEQEEQLLNKDIPQEQIVERLQRQIARLKSDIILIQNKRNELREDLIDVLEVKACECDDYVETHSDIDSFKGL